MRVIIKRYNRALRDLMDFKKEVEEFLATSNDVVDLKAWESEYTSEIMFQFTLGNKKELNQKLVLTGILPTMQDVETEINSALENGNARFVNAVGIGASRRALAVLIVEQEKVEQTRSNSNGSRKRKDKDTVTDRVTDT